MLQKIRDGLQGQKWLAGLILGAITLVFAAWGAYGIVDLNFAGTSNYAAEVDGEQISLDDARKAWSQQQAQFAQQFGADLPDAFRTQMQNELLEGMIRNLALGEHAMRQGYRIGEAQMVEAIHSITAFQIDGKYNPDAAKAALQQFGVSMAEFETDFERDLLRLQVQRGIQASDFVTPLELERLHALQDEQREVRYLTLTAEKFTDSAPVGDAEVAAYFKKNEARYMSPESVRLAYAELRLEQVAAQLTVSEVDLRAAYEKDKARFVQPERRRSRHILIADGPDALKKAQDVSAQARAAGADFSALAKKYSADKASAVQGGDLGWSDRAAFVGPFADALFAMKPGEIRGPVKSEFGYHIIRLDEVDPVKARSFDEVRAELEAKLRSERATDQLGDTQQQIETKIEESSADFDALVKQFGMRIGEVAQFVRGAGGEPLGTSPELQELVFSPPVLEERRIGGPIALGEDRIVIIKALEHRKAAPRPIAEVRDDIVAAIHKERGSAAATKAADAARARLLSGVAIDAVAKEFGVTAEPARFIGRNDSSVPVAVRTIVFSTPKPSGKPLFRVAKLDDGGTAVVAVTASRLDPEASASARQSERRVQASTRRGAGDAAAYIEDLRRKADVSKNPKAFE